MIPRRDFLPSHRRRSPCSTLGSFSPPRWPSAKCEAIRSINKVASFGPTPAGSRRWPADCAQSLPLTPCALIGGTRYRHRVVNLPPCLQSSQSLTFVCVTSQTDSCKSIRHSILPNFDFSDTLLKPIIAIRILSAAEFPFIPNYRSASRLAFSPSSGSSGAQRSRTTKAHFLMHALVSHYFAILSTLDLSRHLPQDLAADGLSTPRFQFPPNGARNIRLFGEFSARPLLAWPASAGCGLPRLNPVKGSHAYPSRFFCPNRSLFSRVFLLSYPNKRARFIICALPALVHFLPHE